MSTANREWALRINNLIVEALNDGVEKGKVLEMACDAVNKYHKT